MAHLPKYFCVIIVVLLTLLAQAAHAGTKPDFKQIKGAALTALLTDKTVVSEYKDSAGGIKDFRFTEHHFKDGTTDYIELGHMAEKGLWNIIGGDKVCYKYPGNKVFTGTYCFFVYKIEDCYYNYHRRAMGLNGPRNQDWWTSRFIIKGEGGSCDAAVG